VTLPERLRLARKAAGLTIRTVVKDLRMSRTNLILIEAGNHEPKPETVRRLSEYYEVEI